MSADLFAEFNELSTAASKPTQPSSSGASNTWQAHSTGKDPFDFSQTGKSANQNTVNSQQWSTLPAQSNSSSSWAISPNPNQQPSSQSQITDGGDDDGWGDFEVATPMIAPVAAPMATTMAANKSMASSQFKGWQPQNPVVSQLSQSRPQMPRVSTEDLMTNTLVDVERPPQALGFLPSQNHPQTRTVPVMKTGPRDPSVLFDVDDFELQEGGGEDEDDDEFGDFETVAPASTQSRAPSAPVTSSPPIQPGYYSNPTAAPLYTTAQSTPSMDLLSLDDPPEQPQQRRSPIASTHKSTKPLSFGASASKPTQAPKLQPKQRSPPAVSKASSWRTNQDLMSSAFSKPSIGSQAAVIENIKHDDDEWAAWDDEPSTKAETKPATAGPLDNWNWESTEGTQPRAPVTDDAQPPPMNVPPPSVILSAFPDLFASGDILFKPMTRQTGSVKQQVLSNPKATEFLHGYILLATTAARVIAGRKHRWHRDKILAKSMSISAAGSKGMKLAGVDKTQAAREEREAADVIAVWREHVGRLRSAVAAAKTANKMDLTIPELSESMQIQTAKLVPTAPKACVLCGLKRDERVTKVDYDVEDSFGEWWVEHWGHRACKNFWAEHEQKLRQR